MSRMDFHGVLFVEFPIERQDWPWERARRELERLIRHNGDTEITPATIHCAFSAENLRILNNLPAPEIERRALAAWKERAESRRAAGLKATVPAPRFAENGRPESDALATRWNMDTRRGEFLHTEAAERQLAANREKFEKMLVDAKSGAAKPKPPTPTANADWSF